MSTLGATKIAFCSAFARFGRVLMPGTRTACRDGEVATCFAGKARNPPPPRLSPPLLSQRKKFHERVILS